MCDGSVVHVKESGCEKAADFEGSECDAVKFVFVCSRYCKKQGELYNRLNYAFIKQQQEAGAGRQRSEFAANTFTEESLLGSLKDRSDVLIKTEFIVYNKSYLKLLSCSTVSQ